MACQLWLRPCPAHPCTGMGGRCWHGQQTWACPGADMEWVRCHTGSLTATRPTGAAAACTERSAAPSELPKTAHLPASTWPSASDGQVSQSPLSAWDMLSSPSRPTPPAGRQAGQDQLGRVAWPGAGNCSTDPASWCCGWAHGKHAQTSRPALTLLVQAALAKQLVQGCCQATTQLHSGAGDRSCVVGCTLQGAVEGWGSAVSGVGEVIRQADFHARFKPGVLPNCRQRRHAMSAWVARTHSRLPTHAETDQRLQTRTWLLLLLLLARLLADGCWG